ncbi:MAG: urease accessory protein UreE [Burkholderiales bacterium]
MVIVREKLASRAARAAGSLNLAFDRRQRSRQRALLDSGEEIGMVMPRGEILRGGDRVLASDGRVFEVVSAPERLLHIEAPSLARIAYHLGNRHVPVQVGDGFVRIAQDHVLEDMLRRLGASVTHIEAPFEPEGGAYQA